MAGETNGMVKAEPTTKSAFLALVEGRKASIEAVLPRHLQGRGDALVKSAMLAAMKNPQLEQCKGQTVAASLVQAAQLGFTDVSGTLGQAYLVPYNGVCQLIVGYRGMIELARRSGEIASIDAQPVFKGDVFKRTLGDNPSFIHEPGDGEQTYANLIGCYVIAKFKDGGISRTWMYKREIDAVKKNSGPWREHPIQMALKTVVRRGFKWWPMSLDVQRDMQEMGTKAESRAVIEDILDVEASVHEPEQVEPPASLKELAAAPGIGDENAQPPADLPLGRPPASRPVVGRVQKNEEND